MSIDTRLQALARSCRYGLFTLTDAHRVGLSRFAVADAARRGVLVRLAPGLYADAEVTPTVLRRYAVPQRYLDGLRQRWARPAMPSALTGRCALELRTGDLEVEGDLLVAVPPGRQARLTRPPFTTRRQCWDEVRVEEVHGLRVVGAAQALADGADPGRRPDPEVRDLVDWARNRLHLEVPALVARWQALGTSGARRLLDMERAGVWEQESEGERRAFTALFSGRGPLPDCQVVVLAPFRVDFVFLSAALIIEYDGRAAHERRFEADATRRMALEQLDYRVIVVTASMLHEAERLAAYIAGERVRREILIERGALTRPVLPMQPPRMRPLLTLR